MSISAILKNQPASESVLPKIGRHVTPLVVSYDDDRALLVMRLTGMPFESIDNDMIANRFDGRNRLIAALAKDKGNRLSIWTTLRRKEVTFDSTFAFKSTFMKQFAAHYLERFKNDKYYENAYYIALLLKHDDIAEGATELEDLGRTVMKALAPYDPEFLTTYKRNDILFSQVYEYIGALLNGIEEPIPVVSAPASEIIPSSWLHWGYELQEIRAEHLTRHAINYDMKDFPDTSAWGQFDKILSLPCEFTLTQSFLCMGVFASQKAISAQINKFNSVGDKATHQIDELQAAIGYIGSGELAFGEYHCALTVYGETPKAAANDGTLVTSCFLGECGARFIKATLSAPYTYLSHVPGAKMKPRPMMKSSRNLAATFGMHNYSLGKSRGNPIGDGSALMPLQTVSRSMYSFNCHDSKIGFDNLGEKFPGHLLIFGMTGSGKTTFETCVLGFLERFGAMIFALDKEQCLKIFILALGGAYITLRAGVPTGLAPFQLPDSPQTRQFLYGLVGTCGKDNQGQITAEEGLQIKRAVDSVMDQDFHDRRFSRVLENIPNTGGNCLRRRLAKWCITEEGIGEFQWALDNVSTDIDLSHERIVGFDVSPFLVKDYPPSEPVLAFLFYLKQRMQERGGLMATVVAEFWLPAQYPSTQKMMLDVLRTGRMRDEFMIMDSQSPEDAINSPMFAAIRDLTPTKAYFANPSAEFESYKRCNLTAKEFDKYKQLDKESRTFLIKQGNQSAFATLDLYGLDDDIAVLSGSAENVTILNDILPRTGPDPANWMSEFQSKRTGKKGSPQTDTN